MSTPVVQKRGRGRPPKKTRNMQVKKERVEKEYSMMATSFEDASMENRTAPPIVLKFKLGVKDELEKDDGMILNQSEPILKRGRGRPRKIKTSPSEKTLDNDCSHDIQNTSEGSPYRPRKPAYLPDLENESGQLDVKQNSSISEVKTRLRGRPKTNYLHVQRMWTPKTENFTKHRNKKVPVVKAARGRPRIHPLPDPSIVKVKSKSLESIDQEKTKSLLEEKQTKEKDQNKKNTSGPRGRPRIHPLPDPSKVKVRGRPRESYDPEHIKFLLDKRQAKGDQTKKNTSGPRGRPTKLEALRSMLEDRKQQASTNTGTDSHTSTKCTTPNQESEDEGDLIDMETSQLTFPLTAMLDEIQGSKCGENIENKENLLFVSSKALCDNRKLKEKLLERNDPVFREMKLKFKQELKNIHKLEVKTKPQPLVNQLIRRRGPRGPYKKKLSAAPEPVTPQRDPISPRLIAKRAAAVTKELEPPPQLKRPMVRKKIVPTYREKQQLPSVTPQQQYVTPTCTIELIPEAEKQVPDYPSDLDSFMQANNLTFRRDPVPKIIISKNPFISEPPMSKSLIVTKNPFPIQSQQTCAQKNMLSNNKVPKKRGRPRKYQETAPKENQSNGGSDSVCINLISSDEEDDYGNESTNNALNYTYPTVTNEPVGYDEESDSYDNEFSLFSDNYVSISLISDDEE